MIKLNNPSIPNTRSVYSHRNSVDSYKKHEVQDSPSAK